MALGGCSEGANLIGNVEDIGGSGGTSNRAGNSNGGSTSSAGSGGTSSSGGKAPTGDCATGSGNWVSCENGSVHRTVPGTCESKLPRARTLPAMNTALDQCTQDSQCAEKPNGYCTVIYNGFLPETHNGCLYGCLTDAECGPNDVCQCGEDIGNCTTSSGCKSDQDCSGGAWCSRFDSCPGVPTYDYGCEKPTDQCRTNLDCAGSSAGQFCSEGPAGIRECTREQCAI
jgi:hypothetical protein